MDGRLDGWMECVVEWSGKGGSHALCVCVDSGNTCHHTSLYQGAKDERRLGAKAKYTKPLCY